MKKIDNLQIPNVGDCSFILQTVTEFQSNFHLVFQYNFH